MTEEKKRTGENFHVKEGGAAERTYSLCNRHGPMVVRRRLPARANFSRKLALASQLILFEMTSQQCILQFRLKYTGPLAAIHTERVFALKNVTWGMGGNAKILSFSSIFKSLQRKTMEMQCSGMQKHNPCERPLKLHSASSRSILNALHAS